LRIAEFGLRIEELGFQSAFRHPQSAIASLRFARSNPPLPDYNTYGTHLSSGVAMTAMLPTLSRQELDLIVELLERERSELAPEIRRCHNLDMREDLQRRQRAIVHLIEQLAPTAEQVGAGI
jgi:hypothetical protein